MRAKYATAVGIVVFVAGTVAWSFSGGPPNGVTGAPGEATCNDCHLGNALNAPGGSMSITGPSSYAPGDTVTLTIHLSRTLQSRWGFEITVLDAGANPAGTMVVVDTVRTQKSIPFSGRQYVKHTTAGTYAGTPNASPGWSVKWVAPPTFGSGTVTFYAAGNAANNNGFNSGDFIYTSSLSLAEVIPQHPPVLATIGSKTVTVGDTLQFVVTATDADSTTPSLSVSGIPAHATFVDHGDGTGTFVFIPDSSQVGSINVKFTASDGSLVDEENVTIFVTVGGSCCVAAAGNVDCSAGDGVDIGDLTALIDNLFITFTPLCCQGEANCDGDPGNSIDIGDLTALIDNLFITFTPLPGCQN